MFCNSGLDINWFKNTWKATGSYEQATQHLSVALHVKRDAFKLWVDMESCVKDFTVYSIFKWKYILFDWVNWLVHVRGAYNTVLLTNNY